MRPKIVHFTELDIDPLKLISLNHRNIAPPWPGKWTRCRFELTDTSVDPLPRINEWLNSNIEGRWGAYSISLSSYGKWAVVILFESVKEAVVFRLKGVEACEVHA